MVQIEKRFRDGGRDSRIVERQQVKFNDNDRLSKIYYRIVNYALSNYIDTIVNEMALVCFGKQVTSLL